MTKLINLRTPDEIKKGLRHCAEGGCDACPYEEDCYMADGFSVLAHDALVYINQLEMTVDAHTYQIQKLEKERMNGGAYERKS